MSKGYELDKYQTNKLWIVTAPTKISDMQLEEFDDGVVSQAVKRGRKLRARREARLKEIM
jgi:hypothetical protein